MANKEITKIKKAGIDMEEEILAILQAFENTNRVKVGYLDTKRKKIKRKPNPDNAGELCCDSPTYGRGELTGISINLNFPNEDNY